MGGWWGLGVGRGGGGGGGGGGGRCVSGRVEQNLCKKIAEILQQFCGNFAEILQKFCSTKGPGAPGAPAAWGLGPWPGPCRLSRNEHHEHQPGLAPNQSKHHEHHPLFPLPQCSRRGGELGRKPKHSRSKNSANNSAQNKPKPAKNPRNKHKIEEQKFCPTRKLAHFFCKMVVQILHQKIVQK